MKLVNKVRITAVRQTVYEDLMAQYENPIEHTYLEGALVVRQMHIGLPDENYDIETLKQHHVTS